MAQAISVPINCSSSSACSNRFRSVKPGLCARQHARLLGAPQPRLLIWLFKDLLRRAISSSSPSVGRPCHVHHCTPSRWPSVAPTFGHADNVHNDGLHVRRSSRTVRKRDGIAIQQCLLSQSVQAARDLARPKPKGGAATSTTLRTYQLLQCIYTR